MTVNPIPEGHHTATPYLCVDGATEAIAYYTKAFGAKERGRMEAPGGKIGHAELEIGDSIVMLSDPFPGAVTRPPKELTECHGGGRCPGSASSAHRSTARTRMSSWSGATTTCRPGRWPSGESLKSC